MLGMYWECFSFEWFLEFPVYPCGIQGASWLSYESTLRTLETACVRDFGDILVAFLPISYRAVLPIDWLFASGWTLLQV